jgi:rhodanese-related sulfurtransferase
MKQKSAWFLVGAVLTVFSALPAFAAEPDKSAGAPEAVAEYPHRARYPELPVITTADLTRRINEVTVVDVRSRYEYETLRVKGAVNIPVSEIGYADKVRELYAARKQPMVFYCNGRTCAKSYQGARIALREDEINDVYVYDAGIFDWAKANPASTELLGRGPIKPTDLIDVAKFKAHLLEPKEFANKVGPGSIVVDIRDLPQRDVSVFPFQERHIALDRKAEMAATIDQARREGKTLLIYDKVGHQVQWVQYHLESSGVRSYYFLKGGEEGYFKATLGLSTLDKLK